MGYSYQSKKYGTKKWQRSLAIAITAGLLAGGYTYDAHATESYTESLTGDSSYDTVYSDVLKDGTYTFKNNTTISINEQNKFAGAIYMYGEEERPHEGEQDLKPSGTVIIDAGQNTLNLNLAGKKVGDNFTVVGSGIWLQNDNNQKMDLTINAGKVNIDAQTNVRADGIHIVGGTSSDDTRAKLTINGDTNIIAKGVNRADGIYAVGGADVIINGKLSMRDENGGYGVSGVYDKFDTKPPAFTEDATTGPFLSVSGIYVGPDNTYGGSNSKVTVKGDVDLAVDSTAIVLNGTGTININGWGTIEVSDNSNGNPYNNYSIRNNGGSFTMNVDDSGNPLQDNDVNIKGNLLNIGGKTIVALNTADSTFNGIATSSGGNLTMYLQNGATWNNASWGKYFENYSYSDVTNLIGGNSKENAGYINVNHENDLYIQNYSGNTVIMYDHEGDGSLVENYTAGDTYITNAAKGSYVKLMTDAQGISNLQDKNTVEKVLGALANKLYYEASDGNLVGKVGISSGLTSTSSELALGDMNFNKEESGKGNYVSGTVDIYEGGQTKTTFEQVLTGNATTDTAFKNAGVLQNDGSYVFNKDSSIIVDKKNAAIDINDNAVKIDAGGSSLTLTATNGTGTASMDSATFGIWGNGEGKDINIKADTLTVNVLEASNRADAIHLENGSNLTIDGNSILNVSGNKADGVYAYNGSKATFNGDVTIENLDGKNGGWDYYGATGLYVGGTLGASSPIGSAIDVNGKYTFSGNGNGALANGGGGVVNLNGDVDIEVKYGDSNEKSHYAAIRAESGRVNVNVTKGSQGEANGSDTNTVNLKGNAVLTTGSVNPTVTNKNALYAQLNIGLNNEKSEWTGVAYNAYPEEGTTSGSNTYYGDINLWLANGATWNNEAWGDQGSSFGGEAYTGSCISKFTGGSNAETAGNIYHRDEHDLTINNYSGYTNIFYAHENDGDAAEDYKAGDVHIKNAATGSQVKVITDNLGMTESVYEDVLNTLAGKLWYEGGNSNLIGKVAIASGLTASSAELETGNIAFGENGQGSLAKETEQNKNEFSTSITGNADADAEYKNAGVIQADNSYKFNEETTVKNDNGSAIITNGDVVIDAKDTTLTLEGNNAKDGIISSINKSHTTTIDAKTLNIITNGSKAINLYDNAKERSSNMKFAGDVNISGNMGGNSIKGIIYSIGGKMDFDGKLTVKDLQNVGNNNSNFSSSSAIYAGVQNATSRGSIINLNNGVDIDFNGTAVNAQGSQKNGKTIVSISGGTIKTNAENTAENYALRANGGSIINMNVAVDDNNDVTSVKNNEVVINGNVGLIDQASYTVGGNLWGGGGTTYYLDNKVNLALATKDSVWTGAAYVKTSGKSNPEFNMWLQNGASWNNEVYGGINSNYKGSLITKLTGGASADAAGNILQKDKNDVTVNNYSGYTNIFYAHENDGDAAEDYKAGDVHIKKAAEGSHITLITDTAGGIEAGNKEAVEKVFSVLAQKLYYENSAYDTNLTGALALASGLTSSSAFKALGDMSFDAANNGKGQYVNNSYEVPKDPSEPEEPAKPEYDYSDKKITGNDKADKVWINKTDGVNYEKAVNGTMTYNFDASSKLGQIQLQKDKNVVFNIGEDKKGTLFFASNSTTVSMTNGNDVVINGNLDIEANGSTGGSNLGTSGISVSRDGTSEGNMPNDTAHLKVNGDVKIKVSGQYNGGVPSYNGARWASTGISLGMSGGSTIDINGNVDIAVDGTGVSVDPYYTSPVTNNGHELATINLNGGDVKIVTSETDKKSYYSLASYGGTVNVNATEKGVVNKDHKVNLQGNVIAMKNDGKWNVPQGGNFFFQDGRINIGLANAESSWSGVIDNSGKSQTGEVNVFLQNGAVWNHKSMSLTNGMDVEHMPSPSNGVYGKYDGISHVNRLVGGESKANAGHIYAVDKADMEIDIYKGYTSVFYTHNSSGNDVNDYNAGDIIINHAVSGSGIELVTDNNDGSYESSMQALAQKLTYKGWAEGEDGLLATLKIASGLTASDAKATGYIGYDDQTGKGFFTGDKLDNITGQNGYKDESGSNPGGDKPSEGGDIIKGSDETPIMQGVRNAAMTGMLAWRDMAAEIKNRRDEIHIGDEGIWAQAQGGKSKYNGANTNIENSYWAAQVGYDREMKNGWRLGAMVDYLDGDANYLLGGKGDNKLYSFGVYGSKDLANNDYVDIGVKFGKIENDYAVYNELGRELSGSYDARGYSISAQYGKRFGDDLGYWEPQVQFTWAHIDGTDDVSYSGKDSLYIHQDDFDSFVGRIGIEAGKKIDTSSIYARINLAHEFAGDVNSTYFAKDGGLKSTSYDLGDTWTELTVGGTHKINKDCHIYGDFTRSLSGDYQNQWKLNAGLRFTF